MRAFLVIFLVMIGLFVALTNVFIGSQKNRCLTMGQSFEAVTYSWYGGACMVKMDGVWYPIGMIKKFEERK